MGRVNRRSWVLLSAVVAAAACMVSAAVAPRAFVRGGVVADPHAFIPHPPPEARATGTKEIDATLDAGAMFLVSRQRADGSWGAGEDAVVITSVVIRALCATREGVRPAAHFAPCLAMSPDGLGVQDNAAARYFQCLRDSYALSVAGRPLVTSPGGARHDWRVALIERLQREQASDGGWGDGAARVLPTAYAMLALAIARGDPVEGHDLRNDGLPSDVLVARAVD